MNELGILTSLEIQGLNAWNDTDASYPNRRVDQLFDERVAETPEHPAVTFEGESMSYAELSAESTRLAERLGAIGVGPGALVAICMDRGKEMVVALLAVFKTGGAYLPLDPAFPADRIAFMLEDARPLVVITEAHLRERFPFDAAHVLTLGIEIEETKRPGFMTEDLQLRSRVWRTPLMFFTRPGRPENPRGLKSRMGPSQTCSLALLPFCR